MKAFITGIGSTLGHTLCRELCSRGHAVSGTDRRGPCPSEGGVRTVVGELGRSAVEEFVAEEHPDVIVHLASLSPFAVSEEKRRRLNLAGTRATVDLAMRSGVSAFVFVGRHWIYGAAADLPLYHREEAPPYAVETFPELADSAAADLLAATLLWSMPRIATSVLRACHTLGPSGRGILGQYLRGPRVPTVLGFDPLVQFMHETDLVGAIVATVERRLRGVYNVAGDHPVPLSEVIARTGRSAVPIPEALFRLSLGRFGLPELPTGAIAQLKYPIVVDDSRFRAAASFSPRFDGKTTLGQFAEAWPAPGGS
jgi:UDP-glucose 4-epimerase